MHITIIASINEHSAVGTQNISDRGADRSDDVFCHGQRRVSILT